MLEGRTRRLFSRARTGLIYLLNLPIYWVTRITPRRRNRWIFGAWLGDIFADGPRYLMEHIAANEPDIEPIWLARSFKSRDEARAAGLRSEFATSLKGYWLAATAGLAIVSGGTRDVNRFVCPPRVLNLWHGTGLVKRIEFDSPKVAQRLSRSARLSRVFPFHEYRSYAAMASSSPAEANQWASAFHIRRECIHVTGQPRNDRLAAGPDNNRDVRDILYAPTFRDEDPNGPVRMILESRTAIERFLEKTGMRLHVRLHPNTPGPGRLASMSRIVFDSALAMSDDVAGVLDAADVVVTDYSSIWVDFLLTGREIIFFPYDRNEYLAQERDLYFPYDSPFITPGPKCLTWRAVLDAIESSQARSDRYQALRADALAAWHAYTDGRNAVRVTQLARSLMALDSRRVS